MIWIFGDSFSAAAGLDKYEKLFECKVPSWNSLVAKEFGESHTTISMGGASVTWIINQLITNLHKFNQSDIVIVSDSFINRLDGYDFRTNSINTLDNEVLFWGDVLELEEETHLVSIPETADQKIINNYVYSFINNHYEDWELYYINQIKSISKLLNNNNIELYFWSHRLYGNFSSLTSESNEIINDSHWGPAGHVEFSKYIINRINNKIFF